MAEAVKVYCVEVDGYQPEYFEAASRGKAMYRAFRAFNEFSKMDFRRFISLTRVSLAHNPPVMEFHLAP